MAVPQPGRPYNLAGGFSVGLGFILVMAALALPTSVPGGDGEISNLSLLQHQLLLGIGGATLVIIGTVLACAGAILDALGRRD